MQKYLIRSYSPLGLYPTESFIHKDAGFFVSDEIVYSIVLMQLNRNFSYSYWLHPEEVQLCSALALSVPPIKVGKTIFYPNLFCFSKTYENLVITKDKLNSEILILAKEKIKNNKEDSYDNTILPTFISKLDYNFHPKAKNHKRQLQLFNSININNKMLIRGLETLIKSAALYCHPQFLLEACSLLHISMEVSFHLVCDKANINHLKPKNKVKKAQEYLCNALNEKYEGQKYFEPFYEDRIKIVHPKNNFGLYAQPPMSPDDFYHLYDNLISVYSFLLIGYKKLMWESNWDY
ncbi:MAG: hypothetical protein K8S23_02040 [Candidatus Cloacimonetes bacterium]|nr:hypothetical protein [Candidatus Cloacimonadota bacterium]